MEVKLPIPRSEILKPLLYLAGVFTGPAAVASFAEFSIGLILVGFGIFFALNMLVAYWICFIYHPERLQTEDFQKHLLGDNRRGAEVVGEAPVSPNLASDPQRVAMSMLAIRKTKAVPSRSRKRTRAVPSKTGKKK